MKKAYLRRSNILESNECRQRYERIPNYVLETSAKLPKNPHEHNLSNTTGNKSAAKYHRLNFGLSIIPM
jgi:hypothetical protein